MSHIHEKKMASAGLRRGNQKTTPEKTTSYQQVYILKDKEANQPRRKR